MLLEGFMKQIGTSSGDRHHAGGEGIYQESDFRILIERERERADRNQHQFSLLVIDMGKPERGPTAMRHLLRTLSRKIRNIDEIGWYDGHKLGLLLPYTTEEGARELAEKISNAVDQSVPKLSYMIYTYPTAHQAASKQSKTVS